MRVGSELPRGAKSVARGSHFFVWFFIRWRWRLVLIGGVCHLAGQTATACVYSTNATPKVIVLFLLHQNRNGGMLPFMNAKTKQPKLSKRQWEALGIARANTAKYGTAGAAGAYSVQFAILRRLGLIVTNASGKEVAL